MSKARKNWWQYSRWISNIGRSLRISPPSLSERNSAKSFIQRVGNPTTGTRPWLADKIRLVCNSLISGEEPISPQQPDYAEAKTLVIIGRDFMKLPITTIEQSYCDELINATGNRKYRIDNRNCGIVVAEWFDNFESDNLDKWTTITGSPEIIHDPYNVVNSLCKMKQGDVLFKDWGQVIQMSNYGKGVVRPLATSNHEFRFLGRVSNSGTYIVFKNGGFYRTEGLTGDLIPLTVTPNYEANKDYVLELKDLSPGHYHLYINGVHQGEFGMQYFGTPASSLSFLALEGETWLDEIYVYRAL